MDSMVQRLRSGSFSKTEQNPEDDKIQGKPKKTDSRKEKNEANRKVQFDDQMKGRRPNVVQKRNSWFQRSQGSFEETRYSSSSSLSSDTEAVIAAATALVATADSAFSSPISSSRESPLSTPQTRPSWNPLPRIGEDSARRTYRENQRPADSRTLVPSTSKQRERHITSTESDREDSKALVPGSKISPDSSARGKGRELVPVPSKLEADGKHLDRDDSGSVRRSWSGSSLTRSQSRKDSFGNMVYEEEKVEKRDAKAAVWLDAKTAKIEDRYRQDRGEILAWENKKKNKASIRMQAIERRLEEKRMKALKEMQSEFAIIQEKADKRKARVEAIRRAERTKVTEMARKIQRTGKMPNQCPCLCC